MGKKFKNSKGITLIALVITIVVMLILAGVTINLTLGENGIFTTAQQAAKNYTDAQNKEMAQLSDFTDGLTAGKVARIQAGVQYVGDGIGNLIPVPVGFSYLEGTKNRGVVIKNNTDGNEFVWVPVEIVENYKRVGWARNGWEYNQTLDELTGEITKGTRIFIETIPEDERASVATYGGFYIGRYEAGIVGGTHIEESNSENEEKWTGYTGGSLVVQKNQQVWNFITRDKAIDIATSLYNKTENNVVSKLCSSYAWDSALKFMERQNSDYPTNSSGGNYSKATGGTQKLQPTGYYAINNIYDMGGNVTEFTTESNNDIDNPVVGRGGRYGDSAVSRPAGHRASYSKITVANSIGFRITLFI